MQEVHHAPGEVIFEEGEPSDSVAYLLTGRVEVLKRANGDQVVLGEVGAGEFVGEMGVIEGRPRGASVRAKSDVRLRLLSEAEFTERLGQEPDTALRIVLRLSERLRAANARLAELREPDEDGDEAAPPVVQPLSVPHATTVRVFAGSERVGASVPEGGLEVDELPFHVGRPVRHQESAPHMPMGLLIPDTRPFRLSRAHFSIVEERGGYAVRDFGSHLGTIVNGELIGQHAPKAYAPLQPGDNRVVAGGRDSPYAFRIVLSEP